MVVVKMGGVVITQAEIEQGHFKPHSITGIGEGLWLGDLPSSADSPDNYINHSCDPSLWMEDEVTLSTRRALGVGDEATIDYAMWIPNPHWKLNGDCNCGTGMCRRRVTGLDWRLPELAARYGRHFSPFIYERLNHLKDHSPLV
jgi:hypothetical protein